MVFSPADRKADFRRDIPEAWGLRPQADGDLGNRLLDFARFKFESKKEPSANSDDVTKLVIIGADSPQITPTDIQRAFDELDAADAVISPSTDGGYCLIGMRQLLTPAFENMDWGTETVLEQTLKQLDGYEVKLTEPLTDVDYWEDLIKLAETLQQNSMADQPKPELLQQVEAMIAKHE